MQVTMDHETWTVAEDASLLEVLADLGDKARAQHRIVSKLVIGGRSLTDRDLLPALLSQRIATAGHVEVTTRTLAETLQSASGDARRLADALRQEALDIIAMLRGGDGRVTQVDQWFGALANFVEYTEHARAQGLSMGASETLASALNAVIEARTQGDLVHLADLLEYEILPRLEI